MAWPMPRCAPVTRLTLPERSHFIGNSSGHQSRCWVSDKPYQCLQKSRGRCAVHDSMIEGQTQRHLLADDHRVAADNGLSLDATDAKDGALRRIDDRREGVDAKIA